MCLNMPFFGGGKNKVDKVKLEEKLRIAHDNPEPVFDLSGCGITDVPKVYSLCKVFRKETLNLSENHISTLAGGGRLADLSLLTHLNLASNAFAVLPEDLGDCLTNLKCLNVSHNKLKQLPESISKLKRLERLFASDNRLQSLPTCFSDLALLEELDLRRNELKEVPVSFAKLRRLRSLSLHGNGGLLFPAPAVVAEGTEAVMKALCEKAGIEYEKPEAEDFECSSSMSPAEDLARRRSCHDVVLEAERRAIEHGKKQRDRQRQLLEAEEKRREMARLEEEARAANSAKSKQMISLLAEEKNALEEKIKRVQAQREREREELLKQITDVEHRSSDLIVSLIAVNESHRKTEADAVLDQLLKSRVEMDGFDKQKRLEVLGRMEDHLRGLLGKESMAFSENARLANEVMKTALEQDISTNEKVMEVINSRSNEREALIKSIVTGEDMQRQMLLSLLMERDSHRLAISNQVEKILEQLAALSQAEAKQRDLRVETQAAALESRRMMLSELLSALIVKKQEREAELAKRLREMEAHRQDEREGYWLMQYQRLLDSTPETLKNMEVSLDWVLKDVLARAGAQKYIPLFARRRLTADLCVGYDKEDFVNLGIKDDAVIAAVMKELARYKGEQEKALRKVEAAGDDWRQTPTAPPLDVGRSAPEPSEVRGESVFLASAPPAALSARIAEECVVCLEQKCEMVFLMCGHVCCCKTCAEPLSTCPLCRANIATRILLIDSRD